MSFSLVEKIIVFLHYWEISNFMKNYKKYKTLGFISLCFMFLYVINQFCRISIISHLFFQYHFNYIII